MENNRNLIANDISRCLNDNCTLKESCKRYLQVELDRKNSFNRMVASKFAQNEDESCRKYLQN